jgi:hypothetical protein
MEDLRREGPPLTKHNRKLDFEFELGALTPPPAKPAVDADRSQA